MAVCLCPCVKCLLVIWYHPICNSTEQPSPCWLVSCSLYVWSAALHSTVVCLCMFLSAKVSTRSSFLVTCKHSVCCSSLPDPHTVPLSVFSTPAGRGEATKSPLPVRTASTMEQEVPGPAGVWRKDKVVSPSYKVLFFSPCSPSHACHFPSPYLSGLDPCLFIFSLCSFLKGQSTSNSPIVKFLNFYG